MPRLRSLRLQHLLERQDQVLLLEAPATIVLTGACASLVVSGTGSCLIERSCQPPRTALSAGFSIGNFRSMLA